MLKNSKNKKKKILETLSDLTAGLAVLIRMVDPKQQLKNYFSHTDRFLVEMFHNYAFNVCISVENLKLWLLILKKKLF